MSVLSELGHLAKQIRILGVKLGQYPFDLEVDTRYHVSDIGTDHVVVLAEEESASGRGYD